MSHAPAHAVRCLKEWGPRSVWLVQRPGEGQRTLKSWPLTPLRVLKMLAGQSQPQRQLRGARRIADAGVRTPRPVGPWRLVRTGRWWAIQVELEYVEGPSARELARRDGFEGGFAALAARRIGCMVHELATAGVSHRDLTLENLVVAGDDGDPEIWVIDTIGVRPLADRVELTFRMLDRLYVGVSDLDVPPSVRIPLVRAAVAGLPRDARREVIRRARVIRYQFGSRRLKAEG